MYLLETRTHKKKSVVYNINIQLTQSIGFIRIEKITIFQRENIYSLLLVYY